MQKKWYIKALSAMTAVVMMGTLLTGCGGVNKVQNPSVTSTTEPKKVEDPTPISIMSVFFSVGPIDENNVILKELEKRTNTKLKIDWVPSNSYNDKLNVVLAAGDMPDMTLALDLFTPQIRTMATQGAFWEIGKFYKENSNLMKFPAQIWENIKMQDGKIYFLPRPRGINGAASHAIVRKDWLDNLKMKVPQTIDELYDTMKAFVNNDPDGNGQKDTAGLAAFVNADSMGNFGVMLSYFNGAASQFKVDKSGSMVSALLDPTTRQGVEWLRKCYSEGLIHKDIGIMKQTQAKELMAAGKAGIILEPASNAWVADETLRKTNPKAESLPLPAIEGPNGKIFITGSGYYGGFLVPKKVPEDKLKKIIKLYDYGVSPEGAELASKGLPNTHFTKDGEFYTATEQAKTDAIGTLGNVFNFYDKYAYAIAPRIPKDYYERNKKILDENGKFGISDPVAGLYSETYQKLGQDYTKKYTEAVIKVVLGAEPIAYWDNFVDKLKADAQYQKMVKEMADAYKVKSGK